MSEFRTLKSLEGQLESLLERAIKLKQPRLKALTCLDELDDIARTLATGGQAADELGAWFGRYYPAINGATDDLRESDLRRIRTMMAELQPHLIRREHDSPAKRKLISEVAKWARPVVEPHTETEPTTPSDGRRTIVLKRNAEHPIASRPETDLSPRFTETLERVTDLYRDLEGSRAHLLSVLDNALTKAMTQKHDDAILLAATIIYSLRMRGYKVEPYVARLKRAEELLGRPSKPSSSADWTLTGQPASEEPRTVSRNRLNAADPVTQSRFRNGVTEAENRFRLDIERPAETTVGIPRRER